MTTRGPKIIPVKPHVMPPPPRHKRTWMGQIPGGGHLWAVKCTRRHCLRCWWSHKIRNRRQAS